ncbi:YEATS family domain-containing protein [Ditylenchus destructor]|uniref:YEATS family domain-containing protein n=1 Tax=Ditylenchus destructor TaxID=166010 RepID=A0AAD4NCI8_9BILA|nr:YEATS family domain-containing protein [Ditylenchus destructor]
MSHNLSAENVPNERIVTILYGNIAKKHDKPLPYGFTHQWRIYLIGLYGEDLSTIISKVEVELDPSFSHPVRHFTHPPFDIFENGYAEFPVKMNIDLVDGPTVSIKFNLKFETDVLRKGWYVNEYYDEIVFDTRRLSNRLREALDAFDKSRYEGPPVKPAYDYKKLRANTIKQLQAAEADVDNKIKEAEKTIRNLQKHLKRVNPTNRPPLV